MSFQKGDRVIIIMNGKEGSHGTVVEPLFNKGQTIYANSTPTAYQVKWDNSGSIGTMLPKYLKKESTKMNFIMIKKEFQIPGTKVTLEEGDSFRVITKVQI